jgi:hypothetical protein
MRRAILARGLACGALIAVVLSGAQAAGAQPRTASRAPLRPGLAAYDWHNASEFSPAEARQRLRFLSANGFRTVYLDLGDYLDVADQPVSEAQQARLRQLKQALRRYVAAASSYGLAVHAVGGGPDWVHEERRYLGAKVVQLVAEYNLGVSATERLGGVQLDIEPYLDPGFFADEQASLTAFLVTLQGIVDTYRPLRTDPANLRLQLGFVIPFWFDGDHEAPGPVLFNGTTKPAAYHIIDMVADLPTAYVLVMSYRNFAPGIDGSIYHARREFRYARGVGAACGLVIGQEYANSPPPKITFHGHPRRTFQQAAYQIAYAFRDSPQFRGLSIHDLDSYMAAME